LRPRQRGATIERTFRTPVSRMQPSSAEKLVVVGGVAGGATAAARARRLDEACEIIVFDRGPFISFANCGLPYYVGDVIADEGKLLLASPELFRDRFRIDVRVQQEVLQIDRERRLVHVRDLRTDRAYSESYTKLVLSPGAQPLRPSIPGIDLPGIFVLRTIPDSRSIREFLHDGTARRATIVGAGFIGLEMAENLVARGLEVTVVEKAHQVLPPLDPEMAVLLEQRLRERGVTVITGDGVSGFRRGPDQALTVALESGGALETDLVILGIGVRPETQLARAAGIALGSTGGIAVDAQMRTNDPNIWAVGDAVEVKHVVTGQPILAALAGPANRQGRIAADSIFGRDSIFRGVQATAVCGCFGLTAACTGASEAALRRAGITDYEAIYLHPGHHVGYYPGAKPIHLKLIFSRETGRIYGAQAVAEEGAVRRIDVIALALQCDLTVFDLEQAELCYAPQYGAAKDPVNIAGFIAANVLRGDMPVASWADVVASEERAGAAIEPHQPPAGMPPSALLLDVRSRSEYEQGHVPDALNIPLEQLRHRLDELPHDRELWLHCQVGQRAYYATRLLLQRGYAARNLAGGYTTYLMFSRRARPTDAIERQSRLGRRSVVDGAGAAMTITSNEVPPANRVATRSPRHAPHALGRDHHVVVQDHLRLGHRRFHRQIVERAFFVVRVEREALEQHVVRRAEVEALEGLFVLVVLAPGEKTRAQPAAAWGAGRVLADERVVLVERERAVGLADGVGPGHDLEAEPRVALECALAGRGEVVAVVIGGALVAGAAGGGAAVVAAARAHPVPVDVEAEELIAAGVEVEPEALVAVGHRVGEAVGLKCGRAGGDADPVVRHGAVADEARMEADEDLRHALREVDLRVGGDVHVGCEIGARDLRAQMALAGVRERGVGDHVEPIGVLRVAAPAGEALLEVGVEQHAVVASDALVAGMARGDTDARVRAAAGAAFAGATRAAARSATAGCASAGSAAAPCARASAAARASCCAAAGTATAIAACSRVRVAARVGRARIAGCRAVIATREPRGHREQHPSA
jgi:NADPH-dependent 2,4-dienoyl-CoA reductase/sulfur reductase-like enzyme/rhodanese-related sulfurtransferase